MVRSVLIVGCGDLGCAVAENLQQQGFAVSGVRYSQKPVPEGVQLIQADVTKVESLEVLATLRPEILLYCVAANAQSDESYRAHYVDGLRHVLARLVPLNTLKHVFFVSSTRVYGQQTDALLDENMPAQPADFGGLRLMEAESLLKAHAIPSTVFRLSGIYGPGRNRMLKLASRPADWPTSNGWTNRIHRDDAARFIAECIHKAFNGDGVAPLYVVTDNQPAPQHEVLRYLATLQGIEDVGVAMPEVRGGKRLSNQSLRSTGFQLDYPDYRVGYEHLVALQNDLQSEDSAG